jgi:N-acetylneuraminate synthase
MAKERGADAVKLQTYTADTLTIDSDKEDFQIHGGLWDGYNLYRLYQWAHTPYEWHKPLFDLASKLDIHCFSTPFDETAVDLLEDLNVPAYKIASFEAVDLPLIRYAASTRKPMIISTGMANLDEICEAVETARDAGCSELVLLHCISSYPASAEESNLRTIADLEKRFGVVAGLSDHTLGTTVSVAGVVMGAAVIEKHVTLSRVDKGADSEFSLEPHELGELCNNARTAWSALGRANYDLAPAEEGSLRFRRSIYVLEDVKAGEELTADNVRRIRPGFGLAPKYYDKVLGKRAACNLERGTALQWDHVKSFD